MKQVFTQTMTLGVLLALTPAAHAAGLYFAADGDDLIITAKEASGPEYWSLKVTGAVNTPADGPVGAITEFYDLTGAAGSNPTFDIARGNNGLFYTELNADVLPDLGTITAPSFASLTDGAASYSFTLTHTLHDGSFGTDGLGTATFTSVITINAPDDQSTRFDVTNTLVADANWDQPTGDTRFASESDLSSDIQAMADAILSSYDGWRQVHPGPPGESPNQFAKKTATATSTNYAVGRSFLLSQTADLLAAEIGTHPNYSGVSNTTTHASLQQQLSGGYRGNISAGSTVSSTGFLDINISAIPEPASLALLGAGGVLMIGRGKRRR